MMFLARCLVLRLHSFTTYAVRTVSICAVQSTLVSRANTLHFTRVTSDSHVLVRRYCQDSAKPEKQKVEFVLLINTDDKVLGTKTKDEAILFAKKHDYHLVRLEDDKHAEAKKRKTYKVMTSQQMIEYEEKLAKAAAGTSAPGTAKQRTVKHVIATSKISENDLNTKLKSIAKWLEKKCEIRVGITGGPDSTKQLEAIYTKFETFLAGEARFLQKRISNGVLKFVIMPPSEKKSSQKPDSSGKQVQEE
uniref:Translation initiation factor IF-3 n=1 Tax=Rhipicephalus appendiculatus TaxID=34631 RepID=A0A131Z676_RHIAP